MKATVFDLLKLAADRPDVAKDLADLAAKHGIELSDEVSDEELDTVAGGADLEGQLASQGELTDLMLLDLQNQQQEFSQATQTFANILKQWHDTSKAIVNNLKA